MSPSTSRTTLFGWLVAAGVLANVVTFAWLDFPGDSHWRALVPRSTSNLPDLALTESTRMQSRYAMSVALSYAAPDSTVIIVDPDRGAVARAEQRFWGYGSAADVIYVNADAPVLAAFDVDPNTVVARGEGGELGSPWLIAMVGGADALPADVGPDDYLAAAFDGEVTAGDEGRVFVRVLLAESAGSASTTTALIEWELLPASVRSELERWL